MCSVAESKSPKLLVRVLFKYPNSCSRMQEMHSKRPLYNLVPLVYSPPTSKLLPPTQIAIVNPEKELLIGSLSGPNFPLWSAKMDWS